MLNFLTSLRCISVTEVAETISWHCIFNLNNNSHLNGWLFCLFQTAQHRSEIITEKRFLELEGQYIKDKEAMSKEALLEFKKYVDEEEFTSEFKEERLKRIDSILVGRNQANSRREAKEEYLTNLAYEYVDLTDNWLKLGATFREWHPFTTWEYQGTDFFSMDVWGTIRTNIAKS